MATPYQEIKDMKLALENRQKIQERERKAAERNRA
jgi:hypothetical protein